MNQLRLLTYIMIGLLFSLSASEALAIKVEEGKVSKELAPMPKPERPVGYTGHGIVDGKEEVVWTITGKGNGTVSWKDNHGFTYTNSGPLTLSTEWRNSDGGSGTQEAKLKGEIWPLTVGKKWQWKYKGKNDKGDSWSGVRKCKVKKQVRIKTAFGEYDTYKLVCTDASATRTWWMSPDHGGPVRWQKQTKGGALTVQEYKD